MAPFSTQPPQEPALQQLGVEPVGFRPAMLPRYRDTRGVDHMSLDATRLKPARQPEAVAAGFEGKRNPRDRAPRPDRLIPPAMQQAKQPFWVRLELPKAPITFMEDLDFVTRLEPSGQTADAAEPFRNRYFAAARLPRFSGPRPSWADRSSRRVIETAEAG
jgi:hypothetical protein